VAIFGNLFGQIFGDSAAELEAQGDYFAGVANWRRATEEYRRAVQRTSKSSVGYRRLAAKYDESRLKAFDALVEEIHSHIDVREFTYASEQLSQARMMAEIDAQRDKLDECERRLRGTGRGAATLSATHAANPDAGISAATGAPSAAASARLEAAAAAPAAASVAAAASAAAAPAPRAHEPAFARTVRPDPAAAGATARDVRPAASLGRDASPDQIFQKMLSRLAPAEFAKRARLGTHYRDAVLAYARGDAARAVELFTQSAQEHPGEVLVQYDLAAALAAAARTREAQSIYLRIIERDPSDWQPYYEIAQLQWADGLRDRALATIEEGLARHPRSGYLMAQWGVLLHKMGDPRRALERFYEALQLDKFDDAGLFHTIANLHLELGDDDRARRGYLKALELNHHSIGTMLDYAEFLLERRNDAQAALAVLEAAQRGLRARPGPKLHYAYRSYLASRAYMQLGQREMALLNASRALEENDQAWLEDTLESQRQAVLAV
jgi:tetratricopeptide (TPR) repeat protein